MVFTGAPLVANVTGPREVFTVRPSILSRRSGTLSATRSTTLRLTASRSVAETEDRTAFSAHSTLRPRSAAIVRAKAAASFSTFLVISLSMPPPPTGTGCAAPMLVAGAIAATCAAMVMNTPAEAARAPVGDTYTMTGTGEARMLWTIERIDRSSPPGVFSSTTRAWAPSLWARSMAVVSRRTVTGVMAESISMVSTGWAARAGPAGARATRGIRREAPRAPRRNRRMADLTASS